MTLIDKIGIGNVLNSILVNENIRPAMLVQPADYDEATGKDPTTKSIVKEIKTRFPLLQLSEDYETYQGVIISKNNYNGQDISLERMGEILGYPCYQDFDNINNENISYAIDIIVQEKNNNIQLFSNICSNDKNIEKFKDIANKANIAFHKEEYNDILNGTEINNVYVEIYKIVPTQVIIDNLIENVTLDQDEINKIHNILLNFGFSDKLNNFFINNFQYANPIHKGILLDLLIKEKNDILSPFYPLQQYPQQQKEVDIITKELENHLIYILEKTKLPLNQNGNGKKTKRRRKYKSKKTIQRRNK